MATDHLKSYRGNCHCKRFVYELAHPEIKGYFRCTCSICHKLGAAWVLADEDKLVFVKGSTADLNIYTFGSGNYKYMFCPDCGTALLTSNPTFGIPKVALNIRALQDINIWSLDAEVHDDAKSWPPLYDPPVYTGPDPPAKMENAMIYHGSCHCGAVTVALKSKPLETLDINKDDEEMVDCNCSVCVRNAYIWIYPETRDHTAVQGVEHLTYRAFNSGVQRKPFCRHCGVHMWNEDNPLTEEEIGALDDYAKEMRNSRPSFRNINLRILNDFDCTTLKVTRLDGWNDPDPYRNP